MGSKNFEYTPQCEKAFQDLQKYLMNPLLLSNSLGTERLYTYLAVSEATISSILLTDTKGVQKPIYYVSKRLLDAELRYPEVKKLAYALIISTRKLLYYHLADQVVVLTNYPVKQILIKPKVSGRLQKWAIELT